MVNEFDNCLTEKDFHAFTNKFRVNLHRLISSSKTQIIYEEKIKVKFIYYSTESLN